MWSISPWLFFLRPGRASRRSQIFTLRSREVPGGKAHKITVPRRFLLSNWSTLSHQNFIKITMEVLLLVSGSSDFCSRGANLGCHSLDVRFSPNFGTVVCPATILVVFNELRKSYLFSVCSIFSCCRMGVTISKFYMTGLTTISLTIAFKTFVLVMHLCICTGSWYKM